MKQRLPILGSLSFADPVRYGRIHPSHYVMNPTNKKFVQTPGARMKGLFALAVCVMAIYFAGRSCVTPRQYNTSRGEYLRTVRDPETGAEADLCIIEFDDEGTFWDVRQLTDTLELIRRRNSESVNGIVVPVFIHGWKHNADWSRTAGNLRRISQDITRSAAQMQMPENPTHRRVVGVYIGWRGDAMSGRFIQELTFWNRLLTADRVASINMKETLSRIMMAAKEHSGSKVVMYGHSMGGHILFQSMSSALINRSFNSQAASQGLPVDAVIMANPAVRAADVARFVDLLKRYDIQLIVNTADGTTTPANGPLIASITSEVDSATKRAFPFGQSFVRLFRAYREDAQAGTPSQDYLAAHTDGHTDFLLSHRAEIVDGKVVLTAIPNRYNDTPYWVIRVTEDICRSHGDISNPRMNELIEMLLRMRDAYSASNWPQLVVGNPTGVAYKPSVGD